MILVNYKLHNVHMGTSALGKPDQLIFVDETVNRKENKIML